MTDHTKPYPGGYLYGPHALIEDYLDGLPDETIADLYAGRLSYMVCPGLPYRYQACDRGRIVHLVSLPSRAEMVEELSR